MRRASATVRSGLGNPEVVLLGVDRLDYTKGIGARMRAFRSLLDDGTLDAERCVMIQVATPTREAVEHYQDERHEIERLVGEINGLHARIGQPVLHYLYRSLSLEDLVALYLAGDVMLVTPLRDGMNLVAKEYVASRRDVNGVLVLSEFAGAADQLTDAVLVNPHDDDAMRAAIVHAIEMNHTERTRRMAALRDAVARSDVRSWAERFLEDLTGTRSPAVGAGRVVTSEAPAFDDPVAVAAEVAALARPLLAAFDVDGVLAPIVAHAADAALLPGLLDALSALVGAHSGRHRVGTQRREPRRASAFPDVLLVVGSHGAERRGRPLAPLTVAETERLARLRVLADRAARDAGGGAWVETKPTAVVVHVREADPATAEPALAALAKAAAAVPGAHVRRGHRIVELAARGASKAAAIADMRGEVGAAAVSFVGDDITDEDVFAALGAGDLGVRVGAGPDLGATPHPRPRRRPHVRPPPRRRPLTSPIGVFAAAECGVSSAGG